MNIIFQSPPVVENIFKYLTAQDLLRCAQVCRLWNSMSVVELKRRNKIYWFFEFAEGWQIFAMVEKTAENNMLQEDVNLSQDQLIENCHSNPSLFQIKLQKQLTDLRIKPAFCIAFASCAFVEKCKDLGFDLGSETKRKKTENYIFRRSYLKAVMRTALHSHLPSKSKYTYCIAEGVIGCLRDYTPREIEEQPAIAGFCLPQIPGVQIHDFFIDNSRCDLTNLVPKELKVKCLLVFLTQRGTSLVTKLVQSCLLREDSKVAIGGAIVNRTESLLGSAIAFCGENIEAASVIINPKDKKESVKNKLKIFQETGLLKYCCFGFMFACVARGFYFHKHTDLESSTFHSLYPKVPLIGIFGNGEIGFNYFPHVLTENEVLRLGKFSKCIKKHLYSYSTVFVLIAVKNKIV